MSERRGESSDLARRGGAPSGRLTGRSPRYSYAPQEELLPAEHIGSPLKVHPRSLLGITHQSPLRLVHSFDHPSNYRK